MQSFDIFVVIRLSKLLDKSRLGAMIRDAMTVIGRHCNDIQSTELFYSSVSGFLTSYPDGVWDHGLTTYVYW